MKTYTVNEVFYALQGEGTRAGTPHVFVRFTGCNMRCALEVGEKSPGGFDCDTEFESGRRLTLVEVYEWIRFASPDCWWLCLTGGEPGLQVDPEFVEYFHDRGYKLAIETNGSVELTPGLDWITVSPKVAEHAIRQTVAHEVKYVRGYGQALPKTVVDANHKLISPAFDGSDLDPRTLLWCENLVKEDPEWRLSVQQHKGWRSR